MASPFRLVILSAAAAAAAAADEARWRSVIASFSHTLVTESTTGPCAATPKIASGFYDGRAKTVNVCAKATDATSFTSTVAHESVHMLQHILARFKPAAAAAGTDSDASRHLTLLNDTFMDLLRECATDFTHVSFGKPGFWRELEAHFMDNHPELVFALLERASEAFAKRGSGGSLAGTQRAVTQFLDATFASMISAAAASPQSLLARLSSAAKIVTSDTNESAEAMERAWQWLVTAAVAAAAAERFVFPALQRMVVRAV
jgi:hypothetical protein